MLQRHGLVPHADGQSQHYTLVSMSCHIVLAVIEHGCNITSFTNALIGKSADETQFLPVRVCRCNNQNTRAYLPLLGVYNSSQI